MDKIIKAAIFDLDGTLSYTLDSIAISANEALKEIGMEPYETDRYRYFCGDGAAELLRRVLYYNGDTEYARFDEIQAIHKRTFAKYANYNVRVYEGMPQTLKALKEKGIKLAVLTNKPHPQAVEVVEQLYGKEAFDFILGNTKEIPRKPSPDGALILCEKMDVKPEECLYIGDTATDMQTGNSAGMNTVGVLWGYRTREELEENHAGVIIDKPEDILGVLLD